MSSLVDRDGLNTFDIFLSYSRKDNSANLVSALRAALEAEFEVLTEKPLFIFFDTDDIRNFDDWRHRILSGLRESRLLLACVSPNYLESDACGWEWEEWLKYEVVRGHYGNTATGIFLTDADTLTTAAKKLGKERWLNDLRRRQGVQVHQWHVKGTRAFGQGEACHQLGTLVNDIRHRLETFRLAHDFSGNIEATNPQFTGRNEELEALHRTAGVGPQGVVTTIQGVGGIGKTALAIQYCHAFARLYPGGGWHVRCDGRTNLVVVLRELAPVLNITLTQQEQQNDDAVFERILSEFRRRGASLLLLDNINRPELLNATTVARLPRDGSLHMIATTRLAASEFPGLPTGSTFLFVDALPEGDAVELIRKHQPSGVFHSSEEESAAREIASLLGGLTLAVETAALYLGRYNESVTCVAYRNRLTLNLLEFQDQAAVRVQNAVRHGEARIAATLAPTLERLGPAEILVLHLAALLPSNAVPLPWLHAVGGEFNGELQSSTALGEPDRWTETLLALLEMRLLQPTEDRRIVRMHRLITEVVFQNGSAQNGLMTYRLLVHANARADEIRESWGDPATRWELEPLKHAALFWIDLPTGWALRLANQVSLPLGELGDVASASDLLELAFRHSMSMPNISDQEMGALVNNLGMLYTDKGRLEEGEALCRLAVESCEGREPPVPRALAASLNNLGRVLISKGNHRDAEQFLVRAVSIDRQNPEIGIADRITRLNNLAELRSLQKREDEAAVLYEEGIVQLEESPEIHGPMISTTLHNLGVLRFQQQRLAEARENFVRALEIGTVALGPTHPQLASTCGILGLIAESNGRLDEAEQYQRRAVLIEEKCSEPRPKLLADYLESLGCVLDKLGRHDEARTLIKRAITVLEKAPAVDATRMPRLLLTLSTWLMQAKEFSAATSAYQRAVILLVVWSKGAKDEHPELRAALRSYVDALALVEAGGAASDPCTEARSALAESGLKTDEFQAE